MSQYQIMYCMWKFLREGNFHIFLDIVHVVFFAKKTPYDFIQEIEIVSWK